MPSQKNWSIFTLLPRQAHTQESGDEDLLKVLDFYKCHRAYVRGKVDRFQLDDPNISKEKKSEALKRARTYFNPAYQYAHRF